MPTAPVEPSGETRERGRASGPPGIAASGLSRRVSKYISGSGNAFARDPLGLVIGKRSDRSGVNLRQNLPPIVASAPDWMGCTSNVLMATSLDARSSVSRERK